MRVQVNLEDGMVKRVDTIAKEYGVSRSALCSVFIGQMVNNTEKGFDMAKSILDNTDFVKAIIEK